MAGTLLFSQSGGKERQDGCGRRGCGAAVTWGGAGAGVSGGSALKDVPQLHRETADTWSPTQRPPPGSPGTAGKDICAEVSGSDTRRRKPAPLSRAVMGRISVQLLDGWGVPRSTAEGEKQDTGTPVLIKSHFCKAEREHRVCVCGYACAASCVNLCV